MATDHLSVSQIKLFKACRRAYELKYKEGLRPVETADALQTGLSYHDKIEQLYRDGSFEQDFSRESAMATAYQAYIYPTFRMKEVEKECEMTVDGVSVIGRVDGIAADGRLVEHKTTSKDPLEYEFDLQWDEQILAYMLMTGAREVYYTICRKPTIRQKKTETDEQFFYRMSAWYDEDTESKIKVILLTKTDEEIEAYRRSLESIAREMRNCEDYYRNTCHCNMWGRRCEYSSVCLHYDPNQEYVEFIKED